MKQATQPKAIKNHARRVCPPSRVCNMLEFVALLEKLKTTKRTGWLQHGIPHPESIADHMHRMTLLALLVPPVGSSFENESGEEGFERVDVQRCAMMAAVHDMAEAVVGDIAPSQGIPAEEKHALEKAGLEKMLALLHPPLNNNNVDYTERTAFIRDLWHDYESGTSPESRLVKDLDKYEMLCQAFEYEQREGRRLDAFFDSTRGKFRHPVVKGWVEELNTKRAEFLKSLASS